MAMGTTSEWHKLLKLIQEALSFSNLLSHEFHYFVDLYLPYMNFWFGNFHGQSVAFQKTFSTPYYTF
jgi:hypothetical protein